MAADFGFVTDAAQRHADELAVGRLGDRLAERGLADARGPTRQRIGALTLSTRCCTARYSTMRSLTFSRP